MMFYSLIVFLTFTIALIDNFLIGETKARKEK